MAEFLVFVNGHVEWSTTIDVLPNVSYRIAPFFKRRSGVRPLTIFGLSLLMYVYSTLGLLCGEMPWPIMMAFMLLSVVGMVSALAINLAEPKNDSLPLPPHNEWLGKQRRATLMFRCLLALAIVELVGALMGRVC